MYSFKPEIAGNLFIRAGPYIVAPLYSNVKAKFDGERNESSMNLGKSAYSDLRGFDMEKLIAIIKKIVAEVVPKKTARFLLQSFFWVKNFVVLLQLLPKYFS